jgi:Flp pilus assembly protein TadB
MNDDLKRQLIISALTTLVVGIVNGILGQINWLWLLFAFVGALGILQLYQAFRKLSSAFDKGRRKGLTFLSVGCLVLVTIAG